MAMTSATTRLGCGRDIDEVWQHLDRPPDAHELTCPYCQSARSDLASLSAATHDLREADDTDPELAADPALVARVVDIARAEVRRGRRLPLDEPGPGSPSAPTGDTVSEQAVAAVIRRVGDELPGVEVRRCGARLSASRPPVVPVQAAAPRPASVDVDLDVGVALGVSVPALTRELRDRVRHRVELDVGVEVVRVDIVVKDVLDA